MTVMEQRMGVLEEKLDDLETYLAKAAAMFEEAQYRVWDMRDVLKKMKDGTGEKKND